MQDHQALSTLRRLCAGYEKREIRNPVLGAVADRKLGATSISEEGFKR